MRLTLLLLVVIGGCFALGVFLKANLWDVALGLAFGGGLGGGAMLALRLLKANAPRGAPTEDG